MNFALYLIGFIIVIVGLAWGAMVAGVPQTYIMIGVVILFGIGIISAVKRTPPKTPKVPTTRDTGVDGRY